MSALDAFLTGFFQQTNKIQEENRSQANDYYASQLERARTVGLTKYKERKANAQAAADTAQRLVRDASMPPDIAKKLAQGGLGSLGQAEELWAKNSDIPMSEDFWRDIYGVAKSSQDTNGGDFNEALKQAYAVATKAPESEPDTTGVGKKFMDNFFGNNSMDKAWDKLDNTKIDGDLTAGDALRAASSEEPTSSLGVNYSKLQDYSDAAAFAKKQAMAGDKDLTIDNINTLNKARDSAIQEYIDKKISLGGVDPAKAQTPEFQAQLKNEAEQYAAQVIQRDFPDYAGKYPWLQSRGTEETSIGRTSPTETTQSDPAPQYQTEIPTGIFPAVTLNINGKHTPGKFSKYDPASGSVYYATPDGREFKIDANKASKPNQIAPNSTPQQVDATTRLNKVLADSTDPNKAASVTSSFYLLANEEPPRTLYKEGLGTLQLKGESNEGGSRFYIYSIQNEMNPGGTIRVPVKE